MRQNRVARNGWKGKSATFLFGAVCAISLAGCGTAGGSTSSGGSPPPTPSVTVSVSPTTASVFLGEQQQFAATVTGTTNTSVNWAVNGSDGGNASVGTIDFTGMYTAPAALPSSPTVTITATSQADPSASGTASVTIESNVLVTISPATASVTTGTSAQFTAQVSGSGAPTTEVNWSLTGSACPASCGTLATNGVTATYTAPATVPSTPTVSITATSVADPSKSATATVTIAAAACNPAVSITPASASVVLGAQQTFSASVCFSTNQSVTWTVSGTGCNTANCGTVSSTGTDSATYTAPAALPPTNPVTLVATSAADTTQSASAGITITQPPCSPAVSISPSAATDGLGGQVSFTASVCFSTNQSVTWTVTGSGCNTTNCGTVSSTGANTATYTAPASLPPANPVTLVATSVADTPQTGSASIQIVSGVSVTVSPISAEVALNRTTSLSASVAGSTNQAVTWAVDGVANGNSSVGEICLAGSTPCTVPSNATTGAVDYLAPSAVPSPADAYVTAISAADSSATATAEMVILPHVDVVIAPANAAIAPSGTVEFAATVTGTSNTGVTWQVSCATSGACGTISSTGVYTAPATPPSPNSVTISATSVDSSTQTASATVTLTSAVALASLSPASATAGATAGFPVTIRGYNFVATSPGPGTTFFVNGSSRTTMCSSATLCTMTLTAVDVGTAGPLRVTAQNPDGTESNPLPFVVVPADGSPDAISLSAGAPIAAGKDVTAVQPTTDGTSNGPLELIFFGTLDASTNSCNAAETPIEIPPQTSGTETLAICVGGVGLDPSFSYQIVGSNETGITLSNPQPFDGSFVELTVTISSTVAPGARSLLVTDPENDRAVLSGVIDVE